MTVNQLQAHIEKISDAVSAWLQPDNRGLKQAIDRTVAEGLFSFGDIKHQLLHLRNSLKKEHLQEWAKRSGLKYNSLKGKKVICLHAGNLPLVGLQDFLAVLLTGGSYIGKISKKDPYLLPTLFNVCREHRLTGEGTWSTDLENLKKINADFLVFAGSETSAGKVKEKLNKYAAVKPGAPGLMRTSHFSVAYIRDTTPTTMEDLTEAVFRYGGLGCRSAAIVVAPFRLDSEKCEFTDYIESFWLRNPQHEKPHRALFHRYAYNKAVEIPQAWLDVFLIEEQLSYPDEKFILYWTEGGTEKLEEIVNEFGKGLQSIYSTGDFVNTRIGGFEVEDLSTAQKPPAWWKPDGVDTIAWLQENI